MMCEKVVPRELGVDADWNAIVLIGTDVAIESVGFALGKICGDLLEERVEDGRVYRLVGVAPVDMFLAGRLFDEKLVFGRASGVRTRIDDQLSVASDDTLAAADRVLDEFGSAEVMP